ncbi:hypothetical protein NQ315_015757 [Exocentrus adspersus]|uniref:Lysosomal Pro-X carboxypeptidase n=1 Tax=Exocentrus adspersus TaxID=1586481 RepID=A0AAV8W2S7_9CUCU|nr:hypothetical protein NQ315_015757 [Exocentrus adspersus]
MYIEVPLDHFSLKNNETFKLRYLLYRQFHIKGGPIFLYTGNEGDIMMFAQNTDFLFDIAPVFNALIVFAEHRYYGESVPFGNRTFTKPEYLAYLTTAQALADFVYLIEELRHTFFGTMISFDTYPFVAFGGSYGGMLSAWLRMKYPNSVIGAIASSAPIWFFEGLTPCDKFYETITTVFAHYGTEHCNTTIKSTWDVIRNVTKTEEGRKLLSTIWNFCNGLETSNDVDKLVDWLSNIYVNLAMVNYPYPTNFLTQLPAYPVKIFCDKLNSFKVDDNKTLLEALGKALEVYTNYTGKTKCNNVNITSEDLGEFAWDYQACTELIMPMCSTENDMFETTAWDFKNYSDECFRKFGVKSSNRHWPILQYGGTNLKYFSNIVFSNGLMDPWSCGGVLRNVSSTIWAVNITDGAHHVDLRGADPADTNYVVEARKMHVKAIKKWLDIT